MPFSTGNPQDCPAMCDCVRRGSTAWLLAGSGSRVRCGAFYWPPRRRLRCAHTAARRSSCLRAPSAAVMPRQPTRTPPQGRDHPHQVHHRPRAPGRFPGLRADQSEPRVRRAAGRQAASCRRPGDTPVGLIKSFRRGLSAARQGAHRHRRDRPRGRREGRHREVAGRQVRTARARHRAASETADGEARRGQRTAMRAGASASAPSACSRRCPSPAVSPQVRAASMPTSR